MNSCKDGPAVSSLGCSMMPQSNTILDVAETEKFIKLPENCEIKILKNTLSISILHMNVLLKAFVGPFMCHH